MQIVVKELVARRCDAERDDVLLSAVTMVPWYAACVLCTTRTVRQRSFLLSADKQSR